MCDAFGAQNSLVALVIWEAKLLVSKKVYLVLRVVIFEMGYIIDGVVTSDSSNNWW